MTAHLWHIGNQQPCGLARAPIVGDKLSHTHVKDEHMSLLHSRLLRHTNLEHFALVSGSIHRICTISISPTHTYAHHFISRTVMRTSRVRLLQRFGGFDNGEQVGHVVIVVALCAARPKRDLLHRDGYEPGRRCVENNKKHPSRCCESLGLARARARCGGR